MYASKGKRYLDNQYQDAKKMCYIRTPPELWKELDDEFHFTLDTCASDKNHLCENYFTKETDGLKSDWGTHTAYIHPLYDRDLPKWVEKCAERKEGISVMLLPASTHTKYFHTYIWKNPNCEIRFLRNPQKNGKAGWYMATDEGEVSSSVGYIRPLMVLIFRPNI
jgi:site-specific DNA-methyltransferase (adenine-specific)